MQTPNTRRREARQRIRAARATASEFLEQRKRELRQDLESRMRDASATDHGPAKVA